MNETLVTVNEERKIKEEYNDNPPPDIKKEGAEDTDEDEAPLYDVLFEEKLVPPSTTSQRNNVEEKIYNCCKCSFTTTGRKYIKQHLVKHYTPEKRFSCHFCNYSSTSKDTVLSHISLIHTNSKKRKNVPKSEPPELESQREADETKVFFNVEEKEDFSCPRCTFKAKSKSFLKIHIDVKHSVTTKPFGCLACEYSSYYKHDLKKHTLRKHSHGEYLKVQKMLAAMDTTKFKRQCPICSYATIYKYDLKKHCLLKHGEVLDSPQMFKTKAKHFCPECNYSTVYKSDMMKHITRMHKEKQPRPPKPKNQCISCDYATNSKYDLKKHIVLNHGMVQQQQQQQEVEEDKGKDGKNIEEKEIYYCNNCTFKTGIKRNLKMHVLDHLPLNTKIYPCPECSFTTKTLKNLKRHATRHYDKNRKYKCRYCKYSYYHKNALSSHILYKHTAVKEEELYCCPECPFKTKNKYYLNTHMGAKHSPEIRYKCTKCDYCTFYKSAMNNHMHNRHLDNKTLFGCNQCSFATRHQISLKKHRINKHH